MRPPLFDLFTRFHPIAETVAILDGAEPVTERMLIRTTWSEPVDGMGQGSPVTVIRAGTNTVAALSSIIAYLAEGTPRFLTLRTCDELPDSDTVMFEGDETPPTPEQLEAATAALA